MRIQLNGQESRNKKPIWSRSWKIGNFDFMSPKVETKSESAKTEEVVNARNTWSLANEHTF